MKIDKWSFKNIPKIWFQVSSKFECILWIEKVYLG